MPTNLNRIQVLMSPDVNAKVRSLAKYNRRSQSNICNELIIYALKQDKFREMLEDAEEEGVKMKPVEDPRTRINQPMSWDVDDDKGSAVVEEEEEIRFTDAQMNRLAEAMLRKQAELEKEKEKASLDELLNEAGTKVISRRNRKKAEA